MSLKSKFNTVPTVSSLQRDLYVGQVNKEQFKSIIVCSGARVSAQKEAQHGLERNQSGSQSGIKDQLT